MIEAYLTDLIDIISVAVDEWGASVESTQSNIPARIEDVNKILFDQDGQEIVGNCLIIVNENVVIRNTDMIKIRKKCGQDFDPKDKKFAVKSLGKEHGFVSSHWEVYI